MKPTRSLNDSSVTVLIGIISSGSITSDSWQKGLYLTSTLPRTVLRTLLCRVNSVPIHHASSATSLVPICFMYVAIELMDG